LGREKQGIINPLKAKSNHDNQGLGHSAGTDLTNHWWERVFNESANNLNVNKNSEDVTFGVKDPDGVEVSAISWLAIILASSFTSFHRSRAKVIR
jgi:G-patch domain